MVTSRESTKIRRKSELLAASKQYQSALSNELNISADRVYNFSKNLMVIGGVIYIGYTILDRFLDAKLKTDTKKTTPNKYETLNKMILPLLAMALQQGSVILFKKARMMLINYLEESKKENV